MDSAQIVAYLEQRLQKGVGFAALLTGLKIINFLLKG